MTESLSPVLSPQSKTNFQFPESKEERLPSPSVLSPRIITKGYVARWEHVRIAFQLLLQKAHCFLYPREAVNLSIDAGCELGKQHQLQIHWLLSTIEVDPTRADDEIEASETKRNAVWKYTQSVIFVNFPKDRPAFITSDFQCPLNDLFQKLASQSIYPVFSGDLLAFKNITLMPAALASSNSNAEIKFAKSSHNQSPYCFASPNYEALNALPISGWSQPSLHSAKDSFSAKQIWFQPAFGHQFAIMMDLINRHFDFFVSSKTLSAEGQSEKDPTSFTDTALPPIKHSYPTCLAIHCLAVTEDDHAAFYISPLVQENTTVTIKAQLDVYELKHVYNFCFCVGFECFKDKPCVLTDLLLFSKEAHECHDIIEQQLDEILHSQLSARLADQKMEASKMRRVDAPATLSTPVHYPQDVPTPLLTSKTPFATPDYLSPPLSPTAPTVFRFPLPSAISTLSRKDEIAYAEYAQTRPIDLRGSTTTQVLPEKARFAVQNNIAYPPLVSPLQKSQSASYFPIPLDDYRESSSSRDKQNYFIREPTPVEDKASAQKPTYFRAFSSPTLSSLALASAISSAQSATGAPGAKSETMTQPVDDPSPLRASTGQVLSEAPRRRLPSIF